MSDPCLQEGKLAKHDVEICVARKELERHIENGKGWRVAVAGTVFAIIMQIWSFVYFYGQLVSTVNHHDKLLTRIEEKIYK